jgi:hypothetical protein
MPHEPNSSSVGAPTRRIASEYPGRPLFFTIAVISALSVLSRIVSTCEMFAVCPVTPATQKATRMGLKTAKCMALGVIWGVEGNVEIKSRLQQAFIDHALRIFIQCYPQAVAGKGR